VLRIFRPKREKDGSRRKLSSDELNSVYSSPKIVGAIRLRMMTWAGYVARTGERRSVYRVLSFGWEARRKETTGKTKA
jgi:hypothetical protein